MAKKVIYCDKQLTELVELMTRNTAGKKIGDRLAIPAMYGTDCRLFRQSEIYGSIASVSKKGIFVRQLEGAAGTKILFQLVSEVAFNATYTVKDSSPVKAVPAAVPAKAAGGAGGAVATPAAAELTAAESTAPVYGAAFQKVRELLPVLSKEEKAELIRLLKEEKR